MGALGGLFSSAMGLFDNPFSKAAQGAINAEHGVLGATANGQQAVEGAVNTNTQAYQNALAQIQQELGQAGPNANQPINQTLSYATNPYIAPGTTADKALLNYAQSPAAQFNPSQGPYSVQNFLNTPGMQFQLQQGTNAIENQNTANGLGVSGNTLKALTNYGQGLASTYYNQAFNQAQQAFQTNQNATLQNLSMLAGLGQNAGGQQLNAQNANANRTVGLAETGAGMNLQGTEAQTGMNLSGTEFGANLGLQGATTAGNFAQQAGMDEAYAAQMNNNAWGGLIGGAASLAMGGIPGLGIPGLSSVFGGGTAASGSALDGLSNFGSSPISMPPAVGPTVSSGAIPDWLNIGMNPTPVNFGGTFT